MKINSKLDDKNMDELNNQKYKELLAIMHETSLIADETILKNYFDDSKYLFNLYLEGFKSLKAFCILIGNCLISQSHAVLRMAVENVSAVKILEEHPELLEEYIEHLKFRFQIKDSKAQRKKIIEHYKEKISLGPRNALDYLDYGWISTISYKNDFGYHSFLKTAGLDKEPNDIYQWIDTINMWVHGTLTFANVTGNFGDDVIEYAHILSEIAAKLFDFLCVLLHNHTKFDFVVDGRDYFTEFRECYKKI